MNTLRKRIEGLSWVYLDMSQEGLESVQVDSIMCVVDPVVQRLWDLVRYQRAELHEKGLITDEEYAALAEDHAAVGRLETYDQLRAKLAEATKPCCCAHAEPSVPQADGDSSVSLQAPTFIPFNGPGPILSRMPR